MRAPVSWIREYVDLPADLSPPRTSPRRLTALGLKLEALERPGADITGPLVVGRVLTMEPEPQKNGKTINWCTVDVGGRQRHRRAAGHRLRRPQLRRRRPGRGRAARRRAARRLRDLRAQDLRPRLRRDDLLRPRARPRRGPRRHHRAARPDAGEPGDDASTVLGLRDEVIEFEINPDRAYALSLRGVAREAALAFDAPFTDPALRDVPAAERRRLPGAGRGPRRLPGLRGPHRHRLRPDRADAAAGWPGGVQLAGMRPISLAVDVTNYVMLELGQPIHGYDGDRLAGPDRRTPGARRASG